MTTTPTPRPSSGGSPSAPPTSRSACPRSRRGSARRRPRAPPRHPLRRPGGPRHAGRRPAQPLRRPPARRAHQRPRRPRRDLVASFVAEHDGPVLVASHDRAFLDQVATSVVELDLAQGRVAHYSGGWSDYAAARALERQQAQEAFEKYADQRAPTRRALPPARRLGREGPARGGPRRRAGQAPAREIQGPGRPAGREVSPAGPRGRPARGGGAAAQGVAPALPIRAGSPSSDVVATLDGAVVERHGFRLGPVDLTLARGDRVALAGDNGGGKSTLLGALLGRLPLTAGRASLGARVRVGLIDQQRELLETEATVAEVVAAEVGTSDRAAVRTLLAKYGLGAEHVDRPARSLSYGERTRALMATFAAREVNLLVLDEPTNHLDVAAAAAARGGADRLRRHPRRGEPRPCVPRRRRRHPEPRRRRRDGGRGALSTLPGHQPAARPARGSRPSVAALVATGPRRARPAWRRAPRSAGRGARRSRCHPGRDRNRRPRRRRRPRWARCPASPTR